jgi:hypothetical protein
MAPGSGGGGSPKARYLELLERHLAEAEELYRRGDLRRAGERYWRVILVLLEAAAAERESPLRSREEVIEGLSEWLEKPLGPLFAGAARLRADYPCRLSRLNFEAHREQVLELAERLRALLEEGRAGDR